MKERNGDGRKGKMGWGGEEDGGGEGGWKGSDGWRLLRKTEGGRSSRHPLLPDGLNPQAVATSPALSETLFRNGRSVGGKPCYCNPDLN